MCNQEVNISSDASFSGADFGDTAVIMGRPNE